MYLGSRPGMVMGFPRFQKRRKKTKDSLIKEEVPMIALNTKHELTQTAKVSGSVIGIDAKVKPASTAEKGAVESTNAR